MIQQLLSGPGGLKAGGKYGNAFQWVVDTNTAREACLVLGADEVANAGAEPQKPILTSSCPGWVCYAEKTHPHVLPHLSRLKSPQALMGTLVKSTLSRKLGISPDRIWHVAVMPCFDKKLEASREELTNVHWDGQTQADRKGIRDVDCVITSKEVLMLADSRGIDFAALPRTPLEPVSAIPFPDPVIRDFLFPSTDAVLQTNGAREAGTSGGNLYYILSSIAHSNPGSTIQTVRGRNADVIEYSVVSATEETLFKAARYYGFRNIQNLVRKLKPTRASRMPGGRPVGAARKPNGAKVTSTAGDYGYVEVMACPGGCTNGGGQIKVDDPIVVAKLEGNVVKAGPQQQKEWLAMVDEAYFSGEENVAEKPGNGVDVKLGGDGPSNTICGISPAQINSVLQHWAEVVDVPLDKLAYTSYRAVVSDVGKNKPSETERVAQLAGKIGGGW
jgi:iron only hydrogenase large subunit-like protein